MLGLPSGEDLQIEIENFLEDERRFKAIKEAVAGCFGFIGFIAGLLLSAGYNAERAGAGSQSYGVPRASYGSLQWWRE